MTSRKPAAQRDGAAEGGGQPAPQSGTLGGTEQRCESESTDLVPACSVCGSYGEHWDHECPEASP